MIMAGIAAILTGCFQNKGEELGPEDTLRSFYTELCAGDFGKAESLCDSLTMDGYLDGFRKVWDESDSSVCAIASDILSEMAVAVTDVEKNGHNRTIFYELTALDGQNKEKVATLRKEEGGWKIERITDRH